MNFVEFYNDLYRYACFSTNSVKGLYRKFNRDNYVKWQNAGYLIPLRRGWYAFSDYVSKPGYANYVACKMYAPSYVSLFTALSYYGIIPEAVVDITCVTTQKTASFQNKFGKYSYQSIKPSLYFGFEPKKMLDGNYFLMATPEKAIVDLLYLYPQYNTEADMLELRFDEDFMHQDLDVELLKEYVIKMNNKALSARVSTLLIAYGL